VRDVIGDQFASWSKLVVDMVRSAQRRGQLDPGADPEQVAFELDALGGAPNVRYQFDGDEVGFDRARRAVRDRLDALAASR
jgi:hypothetical protein